MEQEITSLHPLALIFILTAGMVILFLPRHKAIGPFLFASMLIPMNQRIVIFSANVYMVRVLIFIALLRVIVRREYSELRLTFIDKAMIAWVLVSIATFTALWGTTEAFVNRLGFAYTALGTYFLIRIFVRDMAGIDLFVKVLASVSILLAIFMTVERVSGKNIFYVFGGVPEFTQIRDGKLRCQGPFGHPILAGNFGAVVIPLFLYLWWRDKRKFMVVAAGICAALVIVLNSSSSGPYLSALAGLGAILLVPWRKHTRNMFWLSIITVISLHIIMKAPVWALVGRTKIFGASTGWHRFNLLNNFINRVGDWWLFGTKSTAHWSYHLGDVTNMYVRVGVNGGLLTLLLFFLLLGSCFRGIRKSINYKSDDSGSQKSLWALGSALFVNMVAFMGVSYWDQMLVVLYALVSVITTAILVHENVGWAECQNQLKFDEAASGVEK